MQTLRDAMALLGMPDGGLDKVLRFMYRQAVARRHAEHNVYCVLLRRRRYLSGWANGQRTTRTAARPGAATPQQTPERVPSSTRIRAASRGGKRARRSRTSRKAWRGMQGPCARPRCGRPTRRRLLPQLAARTAPAARRTRSGSNMMRWRWWPRWSLQGAACSVYALFCARVCAWVIREAHVLLLQRRYGREHRCDAR